MIGPPFPLAEPLFRVPSDGLRLGCWITQGLEKYAKTLGQKLRFVNKKVFAKQEKKRVGSIF
jgi:hypothetical protein